MNFLNHAMFAEKIIEANITKRWFPLTVSLTVTNRCNLKCFYCYGTYYKRDIKDFTEKFWLDLVDEMHGMGTRLIHLEGGEPLLREDIGRLISHIKGKGMLCRLNSNGYLVPKKIEEIKGLDSLCISLDGDEESNDKNRGKGCYKKVIEAIKAAKEHGVPVLTSTTLTQNNIKNKAIEHVLSLAKEMGFGAQFNFLYEQTSGHTDDPACEVEEKSIRDAALKLIDYKKKGWPVFYSMATYNNVLRWPAPYKIKKFTTNNPVPRGFKHIPCYMGKLMCFVDGDGMVYPCGEHIGNFPALNILDTGFKEAWDNVAKHKYCLTCYNTCFDEYNEVFSCKLDVWWNVLKNSFKNSRK
ncbi:radical SAM/SPASM domain-containing protein [Elusimicrobiota bacterium]